MASPWRAAPAASRAGRHRGAWTPAAAAANAAGAGAGARRSSSVARPRHRAAGPRCGRRGRPGRARKPGQARLAFLALAMWRPSRTRLASYSAPRPLSVPPSAHLRSTLKRLPWCVLMHSLAHPVSPVSRKQFRGTKVQSYRICSSSRMFCAWCLHTYSACLPGSAAAQHASGQDRLSRACRGTVDQGLAARCGWATGCCGITGRRLTARQPRRSADFDAQVFFHASEVQPADADAAAPAAAATPQPGGAEALQALQQGDEVAFTAYPPPAPGAKWAARQARHGWSPHLRTQDCARAPLRIALRGCKASALRQQAALCSSTVHHAVHPPSEEVHGLCQRGRRARAPRRPALQRPRARPRDSIALRRAWLGQRR